MRRELPAGMLPLLWRVWELAGWRGDGCFATTRMLATDVGLSTRQVKRLIKEGIASGYIIHLGWRKLKNNHVVRRMETAWNRVRVVATERGDKNVTPGGPKMSPRGKRDLVKPPNRSPATPASHRGSTIPEQDMGLVFNGSGGGKSASGGRTIPTPQDKERAVKLHTALKHRKMTTIKNTHAWAQEMRKLRQRVHSTGGFAADRIDELIEWYVTVLNSGAKVGMGTGLPVIATARLLNRDYDRYVTLMDSHKARNPTTTVSDKAHAIVKQVRVIGVPSGFKDLLPLHAQTVIDRYSPLRIKVFEWLKANKELEDSNDGYDRSTYSAVRNLLAHLPFPDAFSQAYLEDVVKYLKYKTDYKGDYTTFLFAPDKPFLAQRVERALKDYSHKVKDRIKKELDL